MELLELCSQVSRKEGDWSKTVLFLIGFEFAIAGVSGLTKGKKFSTDE